MAKKKTHSTSSPDNNFRGQAGRAIEPQVKKFKLNEIHPAKYNPRVITDDALAGLAESIKRFGCVEPIIVNVRAGKNIIVGGNQRFKVLQAAKGKEAICITVGLGA